MGLLHAGASPLPRGRCIGSRYYAPRWGGDKAQHVTLSSRARRHAGIYRGPIRAISRLCCREEPMPSINPDRVLGDLYELRRIGAYKTGVHRPTLSPEDVRSRQWLAERMARAGLEPVIDGIANVIGFSRARGRKMLAGSHVETQNHAGWLDGALGVIYALEAARAVAEEKAGVGLGVDVVAFADEEGHFGNFMGSRSFVGVLSEEDIDKARDRTHGTPD